MIQGVIKPMPEYVVHHRGGVEFPKEGRRFRVDDGRIKALVDPEAKGGDKAQGGQFCKPLVYHVDDPTGLALPNPAGQKRIEKHGTVFDKPGEDLVFDAGAYEFMKQVFGTSLLCEPVDGSVDPIERAAETQRLRERVADLEAQLAKKK